MVVVCKDGRMGWYVKERGGRGGKKKKKKQQTISMKNRMKKGKRGFISRASQTNHVPSRLLLFL